MKFLKENLFLVILVAVLVAAAAVWATVNTSLASTIKERSKVRTDLSGQLATLQRLGINKKKVDQAKLRVETLKGLRVVTEEKCLTWSRRDYSVLTFNIGGSTVAAYPVDPSFSGRDTLRLLFGGEYRKAALAMMQKLNPTEPPTSDMLRGVSGTPGEERGTPVRRPGEGAMPDPPDMSAPTPGSVAGGRRTPTVSPLSTEERVATRLILEQAGKGWIYCNDRAMFMPVMENVRSSEESQWMAQVSLWVQRDILDAIAQTIKDASTGRIGESGVPASPIKRLNSIKVWGYVVRRGGAPEAGGGFGMGPGMGGQAVPVEGLEYVGATSSSGSPPSVPALTGRATNPRYDVVHYEFTVTMPTGHLLALYRNLMAQNYHTILDVRILNLGQTRTGTEASAGEPRTDLGSYYYGGDPVAEVTVTGEMLLLAAWTRGKVDPKTGEFDKNYPALMPEEFLRMLQGHDTSLLRPEDQKRLPQAGGFTIPMTPGVVRPAGGRSGE